MKQENQQLRNTKIRLEEETSRQKEAQGRLTKKADLAVKQKKAAVEKFQESENKAKLLTDQNNRY